MSLWSIVAFVLGTVLVGWRVLTRKEPILTVALAVCWLLAAGRVAAEAGMLVVYTPSVPVGVYWRRDLASDEPHLDQYVCLEATSEAAPAVLREGVQAGWLPRAWRTEPLVKRVAALEGAVVTYDGDHLVVDEKGLPLSKIKRADSTGRALPSPSYPVRVGGQHVWLRSEHIDGFDSRYFGAVSRSALTCVAEPVWTW